jgi:membrane-associated phospholipid phosphatase
MAKPNNDLASRNRVLSTQRALIVFSLSAAVLTLLRLHFGAVQLHILSDRLPWFELMHGFTALGDGAFALIIVLWLFLKKSNRSIWLVFLVGFSLASLLPQLGKLLGPEAARPQAVIEGLRFSTLFDPAYYRSFPSGHSSLGAFFALFLAYRKPQWVWIYLIFGVLIGLSRIILHYHWTEDVIVGWAIGLGAAWFAERTLGNKFENYGTT